MAAQGADLFADEGQSLEKDDWSEQAKSQAVGDSAFEAVRALGEQAVNEHDHSETNRSAEKGQGVESATEFGGSGRVVGEQ